MRGMIAAGLIGGLVAGVAFIAYDLFLRAPPADEGQRLSAIEERLDALAQREEADPAALNAVENRLALVEDEASQALQIAREASERPMPEIPTIPTEAIEANTQAVGALRGQLDTLSAQSGRMEGAITDLQSTWTAEWRSAASRLAAANHLAVAIAQGRPYVETYHVLSDLGVPVEQLSALEPFAQEGAPGPAALAELLRRAATQMRREQAAEAPAAPDVGGGFLQRLAERAITVEAVDAAPPVEAPREIAAIEAAVLAGDYETAAAGWDALPDPVREATAEWAETLRMRIAAAQAADNIGNEALAALAASR